ncbi:hypothetical protein AVEN_107576-1 [Araneus ventricosus]|uniref:THAP9-like helix-turn-helix domain-containing protein n=1 Tax=Araneus ventricosus TaxID=182803 RepID=A0A4Y1ZXB6_ARAVE|nr:hypothetical protein AVEN_107576-1 [Araneus ventricosus]
MTHSHPGWWKEDPCSGVGEACKGPAEQLLKRTQVGTSKENYPAELRAFALTLQFYSNKGYEYVRRTFSTSLPHPATLKT